MCVDYDVLVIDALERPRWQASQQDQWLGEAHGEFSLARRLYFLSVSQSRPQCKKKKSIISHIYQLSSAPFILDLLVSSNGYYTTISLGS